MPNRAGIRTWTLTLTLLATTLFATLALSAPALAQ